MKILILGNGAREHSLARAFKDDELYFYPKNELFLKQSLRQDLDLVSQAKSLKIDLVVVGSEEFLVNGVSDDLRKNGLLVFGPSKKAALLEGSKVYMKDFLTKYKIKTASFLSTSSLSSATQFIKNFKSEKIVIKANGLCAGKGVLILNSKEEALKCVREMLDGSSFGEAGKSVVIEEYLAGFELSVFTLYDDKSYINLPVAQDYKRLKDGNKGPNTGGMGAYAPAMSSNSKLMRSIDKDIIAPTIKGLQNEDLSYRGVLFTGVMVVGETPYVLEYNVRFGDPETQVLLPLVKNIKELLLACAKGELDKCKLEVSQDFAVCVVAASLNYPFSKSSKEELFLDEKPLKTPQFLSFKNQFLSFAGISQENGVFYADGGRVFSCVGVGDTLVKAANSSYALMKRLNFKGKIFRKDIAKDKD